MISMKFDHFHLVEGKKGKNINRVEGLKVDVVRNTRERKRERVNGEIDTKGVNESEMHGIPKGVPRKREERKPTGFSVEQFLGW